MEAVPDQLVWWETQINFSCKFFHRVLWGRLLLLCTSRLLPLLLWVSRDVLISLEESRAIDTWCMLPRLSFLASASAFTAAAATIMHFRRLLLPTFLSFSIMRKGETTNAAPNWAAEPSEIRNATAISEALAMRHFLFPGLAFYAVIHTTPYLPIFLSYEFT